MGRTLRDLPNLGAWSCAPGPVRSNICCFQADVFPGVSFVAHGTDDGRLVISKAVVDPTTCTPTPLGDSVPARLGASPVSRLPGVCHGQFTPVLCVDQLSLECSEDTFDCMSWGGGPACLLAAATSNHLYIFSLRNFFFKEAALHVASEPAIDQSPSITLPSGSYHLVHRSVLSHPLLSMAWTCGASGLLLTDTAHRVLMLQLKVTGLDSLHVARGGYPDVDVSQAWSVHSDTPHILSAAGLGPHQPCATAPHGDKAQQHRVTIWWPRQEAEEPLKQHGQGDSSSASSAAPAGAASGAHHAKSTVGAEVIRHPVKVLSMQWSPAAASMPNVRHSPASASQPDGATAPDLGLGPSLALMTVGADWSVRIWVEVQMRDLFPTGPAASSTPTTSGRGTAGTGAPAPPPPAAGMSMSQFCLTLVIEPPFHGLDPGVRPGLRACWAHPLPQPSTASAGSAPGSPVSVGRDWAALASAGRGAGEGPAADPEALALSSKVHWVVISVGIYNEKEGQLQEQLCVYAIDSLSGVVLSGLPRGALSSSKTSAPKAILWGRCGSAAIKLIGTPLGRVTIRQRSQVPAGGHAVAGQGADASPTPQAQQAGSVAAPAALSWLSVEQLLSAQAEVQLGLAAYVVYPEGVPVIHTLDHFAVLGGVGSEGSSRAQVRGYAEVRSLEVATITRDAGSAWAPPKTGILVRSVWQQALAGTSRSLACLAAHPSGLDVAAALDAQGRLSLWSLAPVERLPLTTEPGGGSAAGGAGGGYEAGPAEAMRWLTSPAGTITAVAWLPVVHTPRAAGAEAWLAGYDTTAPSHTPPGPAVSYLAAASAGVVRVYALVIPRLAAGQGRMSHADLQGWGAVVLGCVRELPLAAPSLGISTAVHSLVCVAAGSTSSHTPGDQQQLGHGGEAEAPLQTNGWQGQKIRLLALHGQSAAEGVSSATSGHSWHLWSLEFTPSVPPSVAPSLSIVAEEDVAEACGGRPGLSAGSITCCSLAGDSQEPLVLAGTSLGMLQVWALGRDASAEGPLTLVQQLACTLQRPRDAGASAEASPGTQGPGHGWGVVTAAAQHEHSGCVAAALTMGSGEAHDAVYLWRRSPEASRKLPRPQRRPPSAAVGGWAAAVASAGQGAFAGEGQSTETRADAVVSAGSVAELPLEDSCGCLAWMSAGGVSPLLAVGLASGLVLVVSASRSGEWQPVAKYAASSARPCSFASLSNGALAVAAGHQVTVLSNIATLSTSSAGAGVHTGAPLHEALPSGPAQLLLCTLNLQGSAGASPGLLVPALAQALAGALPAYHPETLAALLAKGRLADSCHVLRRLLAWLKKASAALEEADGDTNVLLDQQADLLELSDTLSILALRNPDSLPQCKALQATLELQPLAATPATAPPAQGSAAGSRPDADFPMRPLSSMLSSPARGMGTGQVDTDGMPMRPLSSLFSQASAGTSGLPPAPSSAPKAAGVMSAFSSAAMTAAKAAHGSQSSLDTGIVDMSAFGFAAASEPADDPEPQPTPSPPPLPRPAASDPLASGMLDMSAFGFGVSSMEPEQEEAPQPQAVSQPHPPPADPLMSGTLDMSAFGFGDWAPPPPPPPPAPAPPPPAPAPPRPSALESGVLDMSAFGFGGATEEPAQEPPAASQSQVRSHDPMASGMLDMSAFSFGDAGAGLGSPAHMRRAAGQSDAGAFGSFSQAGPKSSLGSSTSASAARPSGRMAEGQQQQRQETPETGSSGLTHLKPGAEVSAAPSRPGGLMSFPRVAEPAADGSLPGLLLRAEELQQLQDLLGVNPDVECSDEAGATSTEADRDGDAGADKAASVGLLPSYLRDDSQERKAARCFALCQVLGLGTQQVRLLLLLARALSVLTAVTAVRGAGDAGFAASTTAAALSLFAAPSGGGSAGSTAEAMASLDLPGRVFLATCRLAAALGSTPEAAPGQGVVGAAGTTGASALFRPMSVSLSRPGSKASDLGSGTTPGPGRDSAALQQQQEQHYGHGQGQGRQRPRLGAVPGSRTSLNGMVASSRQAGGMSSPTMRSILSFSNLQHTAAGSAGFGAQSSSAAGATAKGTPKPLAGLGGLAGGGISFRSRGVQSGRTWQEALGVLPSLPASALLWAQASACQAGAMAGAGSGMGALPLAALAAFPMQPGQEERVSPEAGLSGFRSVAQSAASAAAASASGSGGTSALSWPQLRSLGAGLWLIDTSAARAVAESLARSQFARHRDPYECSLMYLALGKRTILHSLFRQANNVRIADFLARDFSREDARRAAAKNAFSLLGQHRYELAAAFFILAGQHWDAVGVLAHERGDPQLALFVARLLESGTGAGIAVGGPSASTAAGPCTKRLAQQDLAAIVRGDVCAEAALAWASGEPRAAILRLLSPLQTNSSGSDQSRPASAAPSPPPATGDDIDPFALDFLLKCGLYRLAGAPVPSDLAGQVAALARGSASALGDAGFPSLALEALAVAVRLDGQAGGNVGSPGSSSSVQKDQAPVSQGCNASYTKACERLLAAALAPRAMAVASSAGYTSSAAPLGHLPNAASPSSHPAVPITGESLAAGTADVGPAVVALMEPVLLSILDKAGSAICCRKDAVLAALAAHAVGTTPADACPMLPPPQLRHLPSISATCAAEARRHSREAGIHDPAHHRSSPGSGAPRPAHHHLHGTAPLPATGFSRRSSASQPHTPASSVASASSSTAALAALTPLFEEPLEVISVEGDKCLAASCSGIITPDGHGRPFAVASGRSGLLWGGLSGPGACGRPAPAQSPSSLFMGLMQQVLDHVRWTPDPWAAMDVGRTPVPNETTATASAMHAAALAAHPERDWFLSGSSSDHVFLWSHGERHSRATYLPILESTARARHASRQLLPDLVVTPHWSTAASIRYSRTGSHFAGLGEGGLLAVWRQDRLAGAGIGYADWTQHVLQKRGHDLALLGDTGSQLVACGRGEHGGTLCWWDTLSPPGSGLVAELRGGRNEPTALTLVHAAAGPVLVFGDEAGDLTAMDLRMLNSRAPLWSLPRAHHGQVTSLSCWASGTATAPVACVSMPGLGPGGAMSSTTLPLQQLLVSGAKDGSVAVVDAATGRIINMMQKVHCTASKNPLVLLSRAIGGGPAPAPGAAPAAAARQHMTASPVTSVVCLQDGMLTCGMDGAVRFHALASERLV